MSSPGSIVDLHLDTHTQRDKYMMHTSVSIPTAHWAVSKQTRNKNIFAAIKRSLRLLPPSRSSRCLCSVLTVRFIHWLDGWSSALQLQSVSQSQGQTLQLSSPPVSIAQRCSSVNTHTHTHTLPSPSLSPL